MTSINVKRRVPACRADVSAPSVYIYIYIYIYMMKVSVMVNSQILNRDVISILVSIQNA
jgi:hypothetical protein